MCSHSAIIRTINRLIQFDSRRSGRTAVGRSSAAVRTGRRSSRLAIDDDDEALAAVAAYEAQEAEAETRKAVLNVRSRGSTSTTKMALPRGAKAKDYDLNVEDD